METADSKETIASDESTAAKPASRFEGGSKQIQIGIMGLAPAHAVSYGKLFNGSDIYPGVEVRYVWTGKEDLTRFAAEKGSIPNAVKDPKEMLGKVNALILGHEFPDYFLDVAAPFIKEGIPVFIPAPFCNRLEEGKEFLQLARIYGAPVSSYSPIAYSKTTFSLRNRVKIIGKINQVISYGPADLYAEPDDVFDHVIHIVQALMLIFGDDIEFVRVSTAGKKGSASLVFHGGLFATIIFKQGSFGLETFVETDAGITELVSYVREDQPLLYYTDMIEMFRTGKEPLTHKSMLRCVSALEALEKSIHTQNWEEVRD
jgi:predicted dehydrogenase